MHRRDFFSFARKKEPEPIRPPWSGDEKQFQQACTGCGECIQVCETQIIKRGKSGLPELNFDVAGCSFCGACDRVCSEGAISAEKNPEGIQARVEISDACLPKKNVACGSCADVCEPRALTMRLRIGGPSLPELDTDRCNSCGECVGACPAAAIAIEVSV